jgi:cysteine-rich repeat protein
MLALAIAVGVVACGGGDGNVFENCGNGVIDGGEQCDDGNPDEGDACLTTCELNVCGDGFVNVGVEECDLVARGNCTQFGFAEGTLACATDCTIDTSGCAGVAPGTPTPMITPSGGGETPTPTPTPGGATSPSATPTPGGDNICEDGQKVAVTASLDKAYAGFAVTLAYPASVLIPGTGQSIGSFVVFNVPGSTAVSDQDDLGDDGVDDTLHASLVSQTDNAPGAVFTVTFDCLAGQAKPSSGDFVCAVSASTTDGSSIPGVFCSLAVQ